MNFKPRKEPPMKTLTETPSNTPWHHYRTQPVDMRSRIQRRIDQLEREERERIVNYDDSRYQRPAPLLRERDCYRTQGRQWPWALLIVGIIGFVAYSLMTTPDWFSTWLH